MKNWFKENFNIEFKDDDLEHIYLKSIYTFKKFLAFQLLNILFTTLNLILNSNLNNKSNINNLNTGKNSIQSTVSNETINILSIILIVVDLIVLFIFIIILLLKLNETHTARRFTRIISLICFFNILVQSEIFREVIKSSASEFVLNFILPYSLCTLVIFYIYYVDQSKYVIIFSYLISIITIIGLSLGYNYINDWTSILFVVVLGCNLIYLSLIIEKFNRKYFLLNNNQIKERKEPGDFMEHMNYGYLYLTEENKYGLNTKMKDYLNIDLGEIDFDDNLLIIDKIENFLMQGNYEFNPSIDEKLKVLISSYKNSKKLCDFENIEGSFGKKKFGYKDILEVIKMDGRYKKYFFIGSKIFNKYMLRVYIRYNKIHGSLELSVNDISSICEIEDFKASDRYKKLFLNKFSHEFKNPLLNIKQIINNLKIKFTDGIDNSQIRHLSIKQPRNESQIFGDHFSNNLSNINTSNHVNINNINVNTLNNVLDMRELRDLTYIKDLSNYMISLIGDFDFISNSDFQTFSKEISHLKLIEIGKFKLEKVIKSCVRIFKTRAELNEKNIKFTYEIDKLVPEFLNSDFRRIKQILLNILSNSYKFTNKGEISINVSLDEEPNYVYFEIKDTGTGFNPAKDDKLNLKEGEMNNNIYGMGLGLKIVRILISILGNNFQISSKERNGTTVSFSLLCDARHKIATETSNNNSIVYNETDNALLEKNQIVKDIYSFFNVTSKLNSVKTCFNKLNSAKMCNQNSAQKNPKIKINRSVTVNDGFYKLNPSVNGLLKKKSQQEISKNNINMIDFEEKEKGTDSSTLKWEPHLIFVKNEIQHDNDCPSKFDSFPANGQFSPTLPNISNPDKETKLNETIDKAIHYQQYKNVSSIDDIGQAIPKNNNFSNNLNISKPNAIKILLVDDEKLIRQSEFHIISKYFKKLNIPFEITECSDGVECLYQIYKGFQVGINYDYIITDETMNFMRGSLLAKTIRMLMSDNMIYPIKIFMVTSYEASSITKQCGNITDGIITKPLSQELVMKIFNSEMN